MPHGPAFALPYELCDFPNGLRLITVPAPYPGVVALQIVVRAGSRNEVEPGKSGFAHFFEHMMFRGTPEYPPERYEAVLQATGASSNANTGDDRTTYHWLFTREDLDQVLAMEADRFHNLSYPVEDFRTEALAVLGEYNKDSADPFHKLFEVLRDTAFDRHPYKHTTMGFLADIEQMPEHYGFSLEFFDRFYRPEYTTLVLVGDLTAAEARAAVERHWGGWHRGSYSVEVPAEPPPSGARSAHIPWPTPTLPHLAIAFRSPAYSDASPDAPALDLVSYLGFSDSSPSFEKLVIEEQVVDLLWAGNLDHVDPYLFIVLARVKETGHVAMVREEILGAFGSFASAEVDAARLEAVKSHLRYRFALGMNHSDAIAATLAHYAGLGRTPETINRLYEVYDSITPGTLREVAARYFVEAGRTIVSLASEGAA